MPATDSVTMRLQTLAARGASGIATRGGLAAQVSAIGGAGVAAGREVYDRVTGQIVTVIGSTIAYVAAESLPEVNSDK